MLASTGIEATGGGGGVGATAATGGGGAVSAAGVTVGADGWLTRLAMIQTMMPASSAPPAIAAFWTGNARAVGRGWLSQPSREWVGGGVLASDTPDGDTSGDDMLDDDSETIDGVAGAGAVIRAVASPAASFAITPIGPLCGGIELVLRRLLALRSSFQLPLGIEPSLTRRTSSTAMGWLPSSSHGSGRWPNCWRMYDAIDELDAVSPALPAN